MTFTCPKCKKHAIRFGDRACPVCGFSLDLGSLSIFYFRRHKRRLVKWLREVAVLTCPTCHTVNPVSALACGNCGTAITVRSAARAARAVARAKLAPAGRALQQTARAVPVRWVRLVVQLGYLGASGWLFHHYVMEAIKHPILQLLIGAGVAALVVFVLLLLGAWLLPRTILANIQTDATWLFKLGLVCNVFTLITLLVLKSDTWWMPALFCAGLLFIVYLAALFITRVIWPVATGLAQAYAQVQGGTFNPSNPQGRTGYTI